MTYKYLNRIYKQGDIYLKLAGELKTYSIFSKALIGFTDVMNINLKIYTAIEHILNTISELSSTASEIILQTIKLNIGKEGLLPINTKETVAWLKDYSGLIESTNANYTKAENCLKMCSAIDEIISLNLENNIGILYNVNAFNKLLVSTSVAMTLLMDVETAVVVDTNILFKLLSSVGITENVNVQTILSKITRLELEAQHTIGEIKELSNNIKTIVSNAIKLSNLLGSTTSGFEIITNCINEITDTMYNELELFTETVISTKETLSNALKLTSGSKQEIAQLLGEIETILRKTFYYRAIVEELDKYTTIINLIADKATVEKLDKLLSNSENLQKIKTLVNEYRKLR